MQLLTVSLHLDHSRAGLALAAFTRGTSGLLHASSSRLALGGRRLGGGRSHCGDAQIELFSNTVNWRVRISRKYEVMKIENGVVWKMEGGRTAREDAFT